MKQVRLTKAAGTLTFDTPLDYVLGTLRNGVYDISIKAVKERRSLPQNDLMWLWLTCIEIETGTPRDDVYAYYCKKFLARPVTIGGKTEWVVGSSSKLSKDAMTDFLNKIQADAASELGITLPSPEDRFFETFRNEYE